MTYDSLSVWKVDFITTKFPTRLVSFDEKYYYLKEERILSFGGDIMPSRRRSHDQEIQTVTCKSKSVFKSRAVHAFALLAFAWLFAACYQYE